MTDNEILIRNWTDTGEEEDDLLMWLYFGGYDKQSEDALIYIIPDEPSPELGASFDAKWAQFVIDPEKIRAHELETPIPESLLRKVLEHPTTKVGTCRIGSIVTHTAFGPGSVLWIDVMDKELTDELERLEGLRYTDW